MNKITQWVVDNPCQTVALIYMLLATIWSVCMAVNGLSEAGTVMVGIYYGGSVTLVYSLAKFFDGMA